MSNNSVNYLEQNCRPYWPLWTCILGNISGLCSTTLWFLVLLPQVWKNFRRKSVTGLSVLWATANFTASLINLFFVFIYVSIPIYGQISSVYCPILEFTLMVQFCIYGRNRKLHKLLYGGACAILWAVIIIVELSFSLGNILEYSAIFLWCVETFPQVILNMKLHSTFGQSQGSVFIAMLGKTTDLICNNILVLPLQYIISTYFSSSVAYVNGLQVAWYYGQQEDRDKQRSSTNQNNGIDNPGYRSQFDSDINSDMREHASSSDEPLPTQNKKSIVLILRVASMVVLGLLLVFCVVVFVWNVNSFFGLFAPVSILTVLALAQMYLKKCSGSFEL